MVIKTENGANQIFSKNVTDEELANYRRHPEAYFGVIQGTTKTMNDPYEFFEWMVGCYSGTPKDQLLKLCDEADDFDALTGLDQGDLVLALCERWTAAAIARQRKGVPALASSTSVSSETEPQIGVGSIERP